MKTRLIGAADLSFSGAGGIMGTRSIKRSLILPASFLAVFLASSPAYADAGTPLVWFGMLHLVVGNIFIGFLEGRIIAAFLGVRKTSAVSIMIAANFTSMLIGYFSFEGFERTLAPKFLGEHPLYNALPLLIMLVAASFVLTVLIEWPFCLAAVRKLDSRLKKSIFASVLVQAVSYALLVPFYFLASGTSLFTRADIDHSVVTNAEDPVTIFFISPKDGDVYRIRLNGSRLEKICEFGGKDHNVRLFLRKAEDGAAWDLWVRPDRSKDSDIMLVFGLTSAAAEQNPYREDNEYTWFSFGPAADMRAEDKRNWNVRTGFWAFEGLLARNEETGERINAALETSFLEWYARNATVLPSDKVVYQLGDQIVLLDLNTRKIGLVTIGRGPVVVLDKDIREQPRPTAHPSGNHKAVTASPSNPHPET